MFHELSVTTQGVILRDTRIVIPKSLRITLRGHQGIVKTKRLIRSRVWFHGIDDMVEQHVRRFRECQANSDRQSFEPLKPSKMPEKPTSSDPHQEAGTGLSTYVSTQTKRLFNKIRTPSEDCVEPVLDHLFSTFGAPEHYKTDNESPFQAYRFKACAEKWGFKHSKVTPEWPRANGKAESFMKKLGKVLKTAKISGKNEQEALREFLRWYHETPHLTTDVAPNYLFLGFSRISGIPSMIPETHTQTHAHARKCI
jgi:transposase InsO family protein